ncbi:hypothetical protein [uncultured Cetobacterium sp.]|uniref:hypothetical protein n=1 Tax=uncultured Cetobacterium sp. TaxID=527638 RepID=UPI00261373D4|nr:hypothetical protein [uncultured Cetobacterium sp.]
MATAKETKDLKAKETPTELVGETPEKETKFKVEKPAKATYTERKLTLNAINFCGIDDEILTLSEPEITIKADDEKKQRIADVLIKTGKLIKIK